KSPSTASPLPATASACGRLPSNATSRPAAARNAPKTDPSAPAPATRICSSCIVPLLVSARGALLISRPSVSRIPNFTLRRTTSMSEPKRASQSDVPTSNGRLLGWVDEMARLTKPDRVYWCDGSLEEKERLTAEAVERGILIPLNPEKRPGCYLHRSSPTD